MKSCKIKSAASKATALNSGASLIKEELFWQINIIAVVICIPAEQSTKYVAQ